MAFTKEDVIEVMRKTGVVPLFTHEDPDDAWEAVCAAYRGGVRAFEFTNRRPNSYEVFQHLVNKRGELRGLMLGIGTIMDGANTEKFITAGADFIISPVVKTEMASVCNRHDKPWIPGCATLTEIVTARDHGAAIIKVFPGSVLGPGFVSAILPVVPDLRLMITGGVEPTKENLSGWFNAGAMCVGMGSQLFTKDILRNKDWNLLEKRVAHAVALAAEVRGLAS